MKNRLLIFSLLICTSVMTLQAKTNSDSDTLSNVVIQNQQIISKKKLVGKIKKTVLPSNLPNATNHTVQIFGKSGKLIAEYVIEVLNKQRRNQDVIIAAQVKTLKDNVVHNGNNFIDFHIKSRNEDAVLQLNKVVEYLLMYNYF